MSKPFIHLHVHTEYSLLDGAARIKRLFKACGDKNMPAVALTDHGNMYGAMDFYYAANKYSGIDADPVIDPQYKVKPIYGTEFYYCPNIHEKDKDKIYHLVLLVKNEEGYRNIIKLNSMAFVEEDAFYYKPRIDEQMLREHCGGLICLTACLAGVIPQYLLNDEYDKALAHGKMLLELFGKDDLYVELQDHGIPEQRKIMQPLVTLARELGVKVVATNDVHYIDASDAEMHDVLLCIQTGAKIADENRMRFSTDQFYLKDYEEMEKLFGWIPEALETPFEIADKIECITFNKRRLIPNYREEWTGGLSAADYLTKLTYDRLSTRYAEVTEEIKARIEMELKIIIDMGFADYYLIVWDFIDYAKSQNIPVGPGRGSGVGSIIAYIIGITNMDPLKYNLFFERFLTNERVSNPDFDIDFCFERRTEVIEYVRGKYGKDNVSQIVTFGTLAPKAAIKDVARVYDMPIPRVNEITKTIGNAKGSLGQLLGFEPKKKPEDPDLFLADFIRLYNQNEDARKVIDMALKVENMPRHTGIHAAGVLICGAPCSDFLPLAKNGADVTTQYNKDQVEALGLLKMDFLGLKTLTDIDKAVSYIPEEKRKTFNINALPTDDKAVYDKIASGDTGAIFQLESPGMKRFMAELKPDSLEEVIAGISLYRPGPMNYIKQYVANKHNPAGIVYDHEKLRPILDVTYGIIVYQEQVMQITRALAGFSLGRADILRRIMSKKKKEYMAEQEKFFIKGAPKKGRMAEAPGALALGVSEEVAHKVFNDMAEFANYAFNKSHATAYAYVSYQTAFLKTYYPLELFTSTVNNRITDNAEVAKYLRQAREHGILVLGPNINKSIDVYKCEDGNIRFGLAGIKGIGSEIIKDIAAERDQNGEFTDFGDFLYRTVGIIRGKSLIENLIKAGAFDCFGKTRATLISSYERAYDMAVAGKKRKNENQVSLFDMFPDLDTFSVTYYEKEEYPEKEKLMYEKEVLGIYISGHPLAAYTEQYADIECTTEMINDELAAEEETDEPNKYVERKESLNNKRVYMAGLLSQVTKGYDKAKNVYYRFLLEDMYGTVPCMVFASSVEKLSPQLVEDNIVRARGTVKIREGEALLTVNDVTEWKLEAKSQKVPEQRRKLFVNFPRVDDALYSEVIKLVLAYPGKDEFRVVREGVSCNPHITVGIDEMLLYKLIALMGDRNVKVQNIN